MFFFILDFFLAILNKIFVIFIQILTPIVYLGRTNSEVEHSENFVAVARYPVSFSTSHLSGDRYWRRTNIAAVRKLFKFSCPRREVEHSENFVAVARYPASFSTSHLSGDRYWRRTNVAAVRKLFKFSCPRREVGSSQRGSHNNSAYKAQILWKDLCFANSRLSF